MLFKTSITRFISVIVFLFFGSSYIFAQTNYEKALKNFYLKNRSSFQNDIEQYLIHTNKDVYFLDEEIWFKLYLINTDSNTLITDQANVHVSLFDSDGNLISTSLFLSENGITQGTIELSESFKQGVYYIKVNTYKNQNETDQHFIKEIQILDNQNPRIIPSKQKEFLENNEKINVFPNNGAFVVNTYNQITIKAHLSSAVRTGFIIEDDSNVKVAKFDIDENGLGSCKILLNEGKSYTVSIDDNNTKHKTALYKNHKVTNGYSLINKKNADGIIEFELIASPDVKLSNNLYYSVLERGKEVLEITAFKMKNTRAKLLYGEGEVNQGVYTISIFDPNNTLIARKYFKRNILTNRSNLNLSSINKKIDSVVFNLDLPINTTANVSISIVPEESKLLLNSSTFKKQYLLNTFGVHPSASHNFNSDDFDWQLNTFRSQHNNYEHLNHEVGIDISGKVAVRKPKFDKYTVMMLINKDNIFDSKELNSAAFSFDKNYITAPGTVILSLSNPKGAPEKAKFELNENYFKFEKDTLVMSFIQDHFYKDEKPISTEEELFYVQDVTYLDEVQLAAVSTKKLSAKEELLKELNDEILNRVYEVKENEEYLPLEMVLNNIPGVFARLNNAGIIEISFSRNRGLSLLGEENPSPVIYIDDNMYPDSSILVGMQTQEFVAISVNPSGLGEGMRGSGGAVYFYTKQGNGIPSNNTRNQFVASYTIPVGYTNTQNRLYQNVHNFKSTVSKKYFSTIDWIPNIELSNGLSKQIMFHPNGLSKFKCIINGIADNGTIIAEEILIDIDRKEVISK